MSRGREQSHVAMPECPRSWHMSCSMCPKKGRFLEPWGLGSHGFKVPGDSGTRFFLPWLSRKIVTWTLGSPRRRREAGGGRTGAHTTLLRKRGVTPGSGDGLESQGQIRSWEVTTLPVNMTFPARASSGFRRHHDQTPFAVSLRSILSR